MRTEPYMQMDWSISGDLHRGDRSTVTTESTHLNPSFH